MRAINSTYYYINTKIGMKVLKCEIVFHCWSLYEAYYANKNKGEDINFPTIWQKNKINKCRENIFLII